MTKLTKIQRFVIRKCGYGFNAEIESPLFYEALSNIKLENILNAGKEKIKTMWQDGKFYIALENGDLFEWELEINFENQSKKNQIEIAKLLGWKD